MRYFVKYKKQDGKEFPYIKVGRVDYDKPAFILWISSKLIKHDDYGDFIEFPIKGATISETKKRNLVLKPHDEFNVFDVFVECGYRGESDINIIEPRDMRVEYPYSVYSSPRGSLGISQGLLVVTDATFVRYRWSKTGRLYGSPASGESIININGEVKEVIDDEELYNELI